MRKYFIIILVSLPLIAFSQRKKTIYIDENNQGTTANKFWRDQDDYTKLYLNYEVDSTVFNVKVNKEHQGVLDRQTLQLIRKDLEEAARVNIDSTHMLVIDYYPGPDEYNSGAIPNPYAFRKLYRNHLKSLYGIAPLDQFSVYSDSAGLEKYHGIVQWYPDIHNRLKNTFFKLHYPSGSLLVIHPSGRYYSYFGEYSQGQVYYFVRTLYNTDQGVLQPNALRLLRSSLEASTDVKIDPNRVLVIDYFSGGPNCAKTCDCTRKSAKSKHEEYLKKLYTIAPVAQFNIYSKPEGLEMFKGVMKWRPDYEDRVKNTFFAHRNDCTSVAIVHPDGSYRIFYGEYSNESVWQSVEELANK